MVLSSAIVCDHNRRIADDRRSSFHMIADDRRSQTIADLIAICDPRSYGNQPLDSTWFYLLRSSAITIADLIAICDLRSAIIWKPALRIGDTAWKKKSSLDKFTILFSLSPHLALSTFLNLRIDFH